MAGQLVHMEGVVRPFETKGPFLQAPSRLPPPEVPGIVNVSLGGSGGTTTSFSLDTKGSYVQESQDYKESSRTSTNVRVEQDGNPDNFVEFCRADKIGLTSKDPKKPPAKASSYDPTGGAGNLGGANGGKDKRNYEFQYPEDKACTPKNPPKGGNC